MSGPGSIVPWSWSVQENNTCWALHLVSLNQQTNAQTIIIRGEANMPA